MLHDPSHVTPVPVEQEIHLSAFEKETLKKLGAEIAQIASLPIHMEKAKLWTNLNDLRSKRPMVWINEIPWHEMNVDGELTLLCTNVWARALEDNLRKTIYQWKHMRGDMVVNDFIECPLVFHSTDFGILEDVDIARTDSDNAIYSRHFKIQISEPEDIQKIIMPKVTYYPKATEYSYNAMCEVFDGIIPVKKVGQTHIWFTPWDFLIRWWGVQEAMMDLVMRPEMVHEAYERMVQAWLAELDQLEAQNLLSLDCNNTRIGSGGYGYVSELPGSDFNPDRVQPKNMWGCSNAQIFTSVSPDMHWEFALEHDLKWMERWGLTYYGCCEALDQKMHLMRRIPNLRKVSVSPWSNSKMVVDGIGTDYVMSRKPNPAIFATDSFNMDEAATQLREYMDIAKDGHVEIIMKDISTVRYDPKRLWNWEKLAMRIAEEYAK